MFRKLPDKKKIVNNNTTNNNYSSHTYQNDNNEFVYIDNVNQVLDMRKLSLENNTTSGAVRVNNNLNNQYQNMKYNGGEVSVNYGSYSSYSMQMNYANGYDSTNNTMGGYDMNDSYTNNYSNANGAIVNENKENTISEWILYNNRQEFYNRVDNNQNLNDYQNGESKYYNYSNYSSNTYMKNNFQQIPNSGIQYSGIVNERHSIPYYETLPIPIYTSNTIENNDDSLDNQPTIYDDNTNTIQEKYTVTTKPESSYSLANPNPILTSNNNYLLNKTNNNSGYYQSNDNKPMTIMTNLDNEEDNSYDNYSSRVSGSKPLLSSYSNSTNYLGSSYTNQSPYNTTENKKRISISSRSSGSQSYPLVITTSLQSNLNSRYPYSTVVVDGSTSPLKKYNYDYQYQRSVPSTSYYDGTANESNDNTDDTKKGSSEEENTDTESEKTNNENENNTDVEEKINLENEGNFNENNSNQTISDINNKNMTEDKNSNNNENDADKNENETETENKDKNEKDNENEKNLDKKDKNNNEPLVDYNKKSSTTMLKKNNYSKAGSYKRSSFFSQVIESNNFKCPWPDCDQSFASVTLLNAHEIYSHGTPYPPYPLPQPTYAELADARHRILWHIKNNISTNPLNIYNSNYCSSVQSPNSSIYSSDSPYSQNSVNSAKLPSSASTYKSSESGNTFTETKKSSQTKLDEGKDPENEKDKENEKNEKDDSSKETDEQKENHIIKKISKMKGDIPHLNIDNINSNTQNKTNPESKNNSSKYTQSLSSTSTTMQSLRVQIKVDIKEHLFHYLFTPYIRYSHYTKSYSCFFEGVQGRSIVGEILEDPDWDIRCEDEYSVSYIKMVEGSREAGILFSWERKKVDEWFPSSEDENERPSLYNDIVTINFVVASTKKR